MNLLFTLHSPKNNFICVLSIRKASNLIASTFLEAAAKKTGMIIWLRCSIFFIKIWRLGSYEVTSAWWCSVSFSSMSSTYLSNACCPVILQSSPVQKNQLIVCSVRDFGRSWIRFMSSWWVIIWFSRKKNALFDSLECAEKLLKAGFKDQRLHGKEAVCTKWAVTKAFRWDTFSTTANLCGKSVHFAGRSLVLCAMQNWMKNWIDLSCQKMSV